jgi:serine/threonine protein kinase
MNDPLDRDEEIFNEAVQFAPGPARAACLDRLCGSEAVRQRIEQLLVAHEQPVNLLDQLPAADTKTLLSSPAMEQPGQQIGRYKLREKIGEGGCGVVYVADQEEPVRRRVALKIVKLGMDTRQVVARFEAERQVLALMDHPNIAKVLDGGATASGRPYFVMELVRGIKITDYCDQNNLPMAGRLRLFIQVCKAVQHAHQKGIIHRDLKPSNVLVTLQDGVPVPKVIDFGIAKATNDQRLTDKTIYTGFEQFLGTPAYMSPEQAGMSGWDIDTRSDIYSLGVLLYELLTGRPPFDANTLLRAGIDQMRRIIREQEPARPSISLDTLTQADLTVVASLRHAEPSGLRQSIEGDLDWIVMKLLEKDRTRRYETANDLAADVQRHLENEPIIARPPSQIYRLQKLVRRNRLAVASVAAIMLVLVLGTIGTTIGFLRSESERRSAVKAQREARENFDQARGAVGDLLAACDEDLTELPGMQPLRVRLMGAAIDRYKAFLEMPNPDPAPRAELARLYLKYGFAAKEIGVDYTNIVIPAYEAAFAIQQKLVRDYPENRAFLADLGWTLVYWKMWGVPHNPDDTNQMRALTIFESLYHENPDDPLTRSGLVWALGLAQPWNNSDPEYVSSSKRRLALLEELVREFPLSAEFRRDLANQLSWSPPSVINGTGDAAGYLADLTRANELRAALVSDMEKKNPAIWLPHRPKDSEALLLRPTLVWTRRDLARGWLWAGIECQQLGRPAEALDLIDRSTAMYRLCVEENPSMTKFSTELRFAFDQGVVAAFAAGDAAGAQQRRQAAVDFWRKQAAANANNGTP